MSSTMKPIRHLRRRLLLFEQLCTRQNNLETNRLIQKFCRPCLASREYSISSKAKWWEKEQWWIDLQEKKEKMAKKDQAKAKAIKEEINSKHWWEESVIDYEEDIPVTQKGQGRTKQEASGHESSEIDSSQLQVKDSDAEVTVKGRRVPEEKANPEYMFQYQGDISRLMPVNIKGTFLKDDDKLYASVTLDFKGHDRKVLESYRKFVEMAARYVGINYIVRESEPTYIQKLSLLKSVHVHKKHFVQYEMRTHYSCMELIKLTGTTAELFLEYIERNLPEGVVLTVAKNEASPFPEEIVSKEELYEINEELEKSKSSSSAENT